MTKRPTKTATLKESVPLKAQMKALHEKVWEIAFAGAGLAAMSVVFFVGNYYMFVVSQFAPTRELTDAGELVIRWGQDGNILRGILCVVIALIAAVAEGRGLYMANKQPHRAGLWYTIGIVGLIGGMYMAVEVQMHHTHEALNRRAANETLAAEMTNQVRTIGDTKLEEDAVDRAQAEYDQAIRWRDIANACPSGQVCEDVRPIQRTLGVRDDGIVRGAGVCENCGETAAAITAEVARARGVLDDAELKLAERQAELRGGSATDVAKRAIATAAAENRLDSLMGLATFIAARQGLPDPAEDIDARTGMTEEEFATAQARHEQSVERWLLRLSLGVALFFAVFPNGANFGFGNFGHDDDDDGAKPADDSNTFDLPRDAVRQIGHDPNPSAPAGAAASMQVERTQAKRYVAAGAPRQAWETHNDYLERLHEEADRLQTAMNERKVGSMHNEATARSVTMMERRLEIMRRQAEMMDEDEMTALEAQLGIRRPPATSAAHSAQETVGGSVAADDRLHAVLSALERLVGGAAGPSSSSVQVQPAAPSTVHQTVNVLPSGAGERLDRRDPMFLDVNFLPGETEDEALRRARKLADESACPIVLNGRWMIWRDGTVLDRQQTAAAQHPRWMAFRDYLKDKAAAG